MTVDLNKVLYDLDNKPFRDEKGNEVTMGQMLSSKLLEPGNDNVMKFFDWAKKFWNGEKVEVDNQDLQLLKSIVEKASVWNILIKGTILTELNNVK